MDHGTIRSIEYDRLDVPLEAKLSEQVRLEQQFWKLRVLEARAETAALDDVVEKMSLSIRDDPAEYTIRELLRGVGHQKGVTTIVQCVYLELLGKDEMAGAVIE